VKSTLVLVVATLAVAVGLGFALPAVATAAPPAGTLRVTLAAPDGVPANVVLAGIGGATKTRQLIAKPRAGASVTAVLSVPIGGYLVDAPRFTVDGVGYVARPLGPQLAVVAGREVTLNVTYVAEGGATALHATAVGPTGVSLAWNAPTGSRFFLRRSTGTNSIVSRLLGTYVPTVGATAVDKGLKPGVRYTYSLYTQVGTRFYGPLTITVSTAAPAGSTDATFVAAPSTLLASAADVVSATPTGVGVRVRLQDRVATPLLGAGVTLPVSGALAGGYLGVVSAVSADGRTVDLTPGALSDAFDYYELNVPSFTVGDVPQAAPAVVAKSAVAPAVRKPLDPEAPAPHAKALAVTSDCKGTVGAQITFNPQMSLGGHFATKLDKYSFLGKDVPTGASVDMALTATVTGAAKIKSSVGGTCKIEFGKLTKTFSAGPVPLALTFTPSASITLGGSVEVDNIGLTATGGFQVAGTMTLKNGPSFTGKTIVDATPLTPSAKANGPIAFKVGGELLVGPGVTSENAGVTAGVSGQLNPIDGLLEPYFPPNDARYNACAKITAKLTLGLALSAKAWLGKWSFTDKITTDALQGSFPYPKSPYLLPTGCAALPPAESKDTLLGPGVTKVDDVTVGSPGQWGHVDGFVPGQKTWVLSTGQIADAIGAPSAFANTDLGLPGDDELTAFAGHPTYDAASYQVTLVPTGSTLHVRYVFASEEYPEYVGSAFNDVMAVRVNGKNCATVPGTADPVAVNTVNAVTNSAYFVDNAQGANGYATSMDGLTVPLTCSVPVTPGQAVTVQIAVADTSDRIYDSAVALVDGGIWTD
jgi:hypothetical protein